MLPVTDEVIESISPLGLCFREWGPAGDLYELHYLHSLLWLWSYVVDSPAMLQLRSTTTGFPRAWYPLELGNATDPRMVMRID